MSAPKPIQSAAIPRILKGECMFFVKIIGIIGRAVTGSGKTAAFALPVLHELQSILIFTISEDPYGIFCLVLTPTRELASQIGGQFKALGFQLGMQVVVCTGGVDQAHQIEKLESKPHILVATPGRLCSHIENSTRLAFKYLKYIVLDEADTLLSDSFDKDIRKILGFASKESRESFQILLFSATVNESIIANKDYLLEMKKEGKKGFSTISVSESASSMPETLSNYSLFVPYEAKIAYLILLFRKLLGISLKGKFDSKGSETDSVLMFKKKYEETLLRKRKKRFHEIQPNLDEINDQADGTPSLLIVFTNTRKSCHMVSSVLRALGFNISAIHGLLQQKERMQALRDFRDGKHKILVTTDITAKGIDIPKVDFVIHYELPDEKLYIHRAGRAGRNKKKGMSIALVSPRERKRYFPRLSAIKFDSSLDLPFKKSEFNQIVGEVFAAQELFKLQQKHDSGVGRETLDG